MSVVDSADASMLGDSSITPSSTVDTHMSTGSLSDVSAPADSTTTLSLSTMDTHMSTVDSVDDHLSADSPAAIEVAANKGIKGSATIGSGQGMPTLHKPSS
jgi:hypothetical protein